MTIEEIETLARQLWSIFNEAWPDGGVLTWEDLQPPVRTAWIILAEWVGARSFNHGLTQAQLDSFTFKTVMHTLSL